MIRDEHHPQALLALQRLIAHAKAQAYEAGENRIAELLNDVELLPEFLMDEADRTAEFIEMLQGIAQTHPDCQYIIEIFHMPELPATARPES